MRILIVESDPTTQRSLCLMMNHAGLQTYTADGGQEAIELAGLYDYDLITLEINLPDVSGFEVLRSLRLSKIDTPIVILSHLDSTESKIKAFGWGADDYVAKPFHREELIARIFAITNRFKRAGDPSIVTGKMTVNIARKSVVVGVHEVPMTGREFQILELLSLRKGTTLTKEIILRHLYNGVDTPDPGIIDKLICKLRKKLVEVTGENYIETVWGRGYALRDPQISGAIP